MITAKLLREWSACWTDDRITTHLNSRESITPREVAADESIPLDDRLWVMCRSLWYLDESAARLFAIESASLVAHLAGDDDDQAICAGLLNDLIQIEEEITDAAAWAAARAAAWDAAWAAARAAAWDAAWAAAWDAELRKAIARAIEWLGDYADGWDEP